MEQRRCRRGRSRFSIFWLMATVCFNGATSTSTWKGNEFLRDGSEVRLLQWGHVVVDVEGSTNSTM